MTDETETDLATRHDELVQQMTLLCDDADLDESQQELARAWRHRLEGVRRRAEADLSVAFMAQVGRGKSTLIAAATGLRLEGSDNPQQWSVLPVGDGRTTLGETQIAFEERNDILLEVEPISRKQLSMELRLFAEDLWKATVAGSGGSATSEQAGEELYGLLRAWLVPGADDPRAELRELARASADVDGLRETLFGRLDLEVRTQPFVRAFAGDHQGLTALKLALRQLMRGKLDGGPAPKVVRLRLPMDEIGRSVASLIDTRGIDSQAPELSIQGRADLRRRLTDPDALLVICTEFESAPDVVSRKLIEALAEKTMRERVGERAWRLLIVDRRIVDDDPREQRERELERVERVEVCRDQLRRDGVEIPDKAIVAVDARREAEELRQILVEMAAEERERRRAEWEQVYREAIEAVASLVELEFAAQARELDLRLWWIWDVHVRGIEPLFAHGLDSVAVVLQSSNLKHWSHLHAAMRRRGRYDNLDLVKLGAEAGSMLLMAEPLSANDAIEHFAQNVSPSLHPRLAMHLALRVELFWSAWARFLSDLQTSWETVVADYFESPRSDELWTWCQARWGGGPGYVKDIQARFVAESRRVNLQLTGDLIPRPIEDHLPPRPPLFSLRKVALQNFRSVARREIPITPTTTVLVGDNGLGKTGWLEAIAAVVGALLPGMGAGPGPALKDTDIRQVIRKLDGISDRQFQLPMSIEVEATLQGRGLEWRRVIDSPPIDGEVREAAPDEDDALQVKAREIAEEIGKELREHGDRQLPVLAYYGTQRLWPPIDAENGRREVGSRLDGYRDGLQAAATHRHMLEWMRKYTMVELQRKEPVTQLRAIEQAVIACVSEVVEFGYDLDLEDLVLRKESGEVMPFRMLSDGYRNIVAMVADIAWRASRLNPQLGARAPALAEGIVLIDEIDLHLHPKWQRRILGDLRRAFPRLQFVVTTHSPFIVQSLEPGQLVNLDPDARDDVPYADRSPEDIAEQIMGVELPQRSERRQREAEVAKAYYELLDRMPDADPNELAALEAELDELTAPYSDNQAFVVFLELKREQARAKRA
jgi:predicted ATP-binding protein involved in virulence